MPSPTPAPVLMLAGVTGIGKTALGIELALRIRRHPRPPLELISADSMQVYRGMAIGTAQPTPDELRGIPIHLTGLIDPAEPFNASRFVAMCDAAHHDILTRGAQPLYLGGTGLYLRALRWGLIDNDSADPAIRRRLEAQAQSDGLAALYTRLQSVDPDAATRIAPGDAVRIIRALEAYEVTGRPISSLQRQWDTPTPRFPHHLVILDAPRDPSRPPHRAPHRRHARRRLDRRGRFPARRGLDEQSHCFKALGYREIIECLRGRLDRDAMRQRIILRTLQFARRQRTWLRRERPATVIDFHPDDPAGRERVLEKLLALPPTPSLK